MPNEVYEMTHRALSALVSPRAATRVLDEALVAAGQDPDDVTVRAMRRMLAGTVRRELSGSLPGPGLTHSLKQIADDLYRLRPSHTTLVDFVPTDAYATPARPVGAASTADPNVAAERPDAISAAPDPAVLASPSAPTPSAPPANRLPAAELEADEATLDAALRLFGELETVEQVAIVRGSEVILERGLGVPTARLPNLVRSTRHLLARAGDLRLFALERAEGMLFVFPVGEATIVVVTQPNVNIGAVLAARAALEEAA